MWEDVIVQCAYYDNSLFPLFTCSLNSIAMVHEKIVVLLSMTMRLQTTSSTQGTFTVPVADTIAMETMLAVVGCCVIIIKRTQVHKTEFLVIASLQWPCLDCQSLPFRLIISIKDVVVIVVNHYPIRGMLTAV